ncbi:Motile sperm domain-containing 2 [Brachionus plicatilis]|uniref:Motile sperm domain-containing 2 n=1 Tax=Brachionus plicatilis TaxID=10195 RepID=A0A3M7SJR5_BRAPC|nr:Motile sperm domain-containing 2 [Brachionus plicatilis]
MSYETAPESVMDQIRSNFVQKYKSNIEKEIYHPKDVERIKANGSWIRAFYKHSLLDQDRAVEMIHDVLKWRKDFDCNGLLTPGKLPVPEELFKKGAIFKRNEDIQCNPLLHFIIKVHKKDQFPAEQIYRCIAFFFEKNYKFNTEDPIVLLIDMADAGYSNLDMDLIKFIVNCLKTYYPGLIDYMIVFQMPFIFNAAWKIIKNWLPPQAMKLIKFVDKKSIREFVHESQLFVHMGGTVMMIYYFINDQ